MRKKVIIVDDEPAMLKLMTNILKTMKFEVFDFSDPRNVLEVIRDINPKVDLLITDYDMPGMTGGELATEIKELRPKMKIICVSGLPENSKNCKACNIFIAKPIQIKTLKLAVEQLFPPK
jgi:two-component SAPR family response regulator